MSGVKLVQNISFLPSPTVMTSQSIIDFLFISGYAGHGGRGQELMPTFNLIPIIIIFYHYQCIIIGKMRELIQWDRF